MKFEIKGLPEYTDEALINEIHRVADLIYKPKITKSEFQKYSRVHCSTIEKRFGTWSEALNVAGLSDRIFAPIKPTTKEEIVSELQKVANLLGTKEFGKKQFNANSIYSDHIIRKTFGTWHKAMTAAGLSTNPLGKRYSDEDCFENLLQVWCHYGRQPKHREMSMFPSVIGPKAYIVRWRTWVKAIYAFVQQVDNDLKNSATIEKDAQILPPFEKKRRGGKSNETDSRNIKLGVRYTVLRRDRFKCVICGNSPAISINCHLHVDHFFPFSKGGKTEISNLRTLCQECNLGKSDRIENIAEQPISVDANKDGATE